MKWEGNQPLVGWCAPPGPPLRLGLETLGVGGAPPDLGGSFPPLAAAPQGYVDALLSPRC